MTASPVAWSRLRVHHYWSRSEEERRRKASCGASRLVRGLPRAPVAEESHPVTDDTLARYGPEVREALASRGYARP